MIAPEIKCFNVSKIEREVTNYPSPTRADGFTVTLLSIYQDGREGAALQLCMFAKAGGIPLIELPAKTIEGVAL